MFLTAFSITLQCTRIIKKKFGGLYAPKFDAPDRPDDYALIVLVTIFVFISFTTGATERLESQSQSGSII